MKNENNDYVNRITRKMDKKKSIIKQLDKQLGQYTAIL